MKKKGIIFLAGTAIIVIAAVAGAIGWCMHECSTLLFDDLENF